MDLFDSEFGPANGYILSKDVVCGAYPGDKDPAIARAKLATLHNFGVRHSIDLTQLQELSTSGVPIQPYADIAREVGIKPARSAVVDNDIPTASQAREILKYIFKAEQDGKVYLHCRGGIGRTGTIACLYLLAKGMAQPHNVLRTLQMMRERYDCWGQSPEFGKQRTFIMRWWTRNAKRYSA